MLPTLIDKPKTSMFKVNKKNVKKNDFFFLIFAFIIKKNIERKLIKILYILKLFNLNLKIIYWF